jgi:hypothetical protein
MIDKDITEHFYIRSGGPDLQGSVYICDVTVIRTATNVPEAIYRGEDSRGQKAAQIATAKAKQAINDGFDLGEPRLAAAPKPHWRRPTIEQVKALDDKIFAQLADSEKAVLSFYRDYGRKFGVAISFINEANPDELASASSREQADQLLQRADSRISVTVRHS